MLVIDRIKALALKLKDPGRVLDLLPQARRISVRGMDLVVVPHRLDAVKVLNNIGINAPSPILHQYDWPGRFTPMEHQRQTAAFMTMHKKCIVLNGIGCVDSETEYLSPTGWRKISEYVGGAVAQYWPETGKIELVDNPEYVKLPCDEMIRIRTKYGVDQLLSPEHRVLYVASTGKRMVRPAEEIYRADMKSKSGWSGRIITTFHSDGGQGIPLTDEQLRVQVALMADGHISNKNNYTIVRLKRSDKIARLKDLLEAAGIPYKVGPCKPEGFVAYRVNIPMRDKSYGDWAWSATRHQLEVICDEVVRWDGTQRKAGASEFFTRDKASADFIQYAFAATGRTATINIAERDDGTDYVVHARRDSALLYVQGVGPEGRKFNMWRELSTDGYKYCFMVPSTFLVLRRNGRIFATGNTGKSMASLWAADYLMQLGRVKKVLILSPLSTLERVWGDAIFMNLPRRRFVVLHGTAARRKKLLAGDYDYYIINHDGFPIIARDCKGMFDLVIYDEAAVLRNGGTNRFRLMFSWLKANPMVRFWMLTGTPTPNAPTDAWALARLLGSEHSKMSMGSFRDHTMKQVSPFKWLPRPGAEEFVADALQPSIMYKREDCIDLPPTTVQTRQVPLTPVQKKHYDIMQKKAVSMVESGQVISAVNEAVLRQKLVQIAMGVAYDRNGQVVELDCAPRVAEVMNVIEESDGKVIVFVPLTGTLRMLERELSRRWPVAVVNGSVSANERNDIFRNFQQGTNPHVLIAHPGTMSHGLTLTSATTIIWYGPLDSNETYQQANGRIERIGKVRSSAVVHIASTPLEHGMFKRLHDKQHMQGLLLDMVRQSMEK